MKAIETKIYSLLLMMFNSFVLFPVASAEPESPDENKMVYIERGVYTPFFEKLKNGKKSIVMVEPFYLDITPVTNQQFLRFVNEDHYICYRSFAYRLLESRSDC